MTAVPVDLAVERLQTEHWADLERQVKAIMEGAIAAGEVIVGRLAEAGRPPAERTAGPLPGAEKAATAPPTMALLMRAAVGAGHSRKALQTVLVRLAVPVAVAPEAAAFPAATYRQQREQSIGAVAVAVESGAHHLTAPQAVLAS